MQYFPPALEKLVEQFARLPGIGRKSAQRLAFFVLSLPEGEAAEFAQAVLELRKRHPDVTLEGVRPYEKQADSWSPADRKRYWAILDQCDYETLVQHHYDRFCMMRRNRYMVDRSARIIALYNGQPKGGTAQTLAYALGKKLETEILHPEEEE